MATTNEKITKFIEKSKLNDVNYFFDMVKVAQYRTRRDHKEMVLNEIKFELTYRCTPTTQQNTERNNTNTIKKDNRTPKAHTETQINRYATEKFKEHSRHSQAVQDYYNKPYLDQPFKTPKEKIASQAFLERHLRHIERLWRDQEDELDKYDCNYCRKKGHIEADCFKKMLEIKPKEVCNYCHRENHKESECRLKPRMRRHCAFCDNIGHESMKNHHPECSRRWKPLKKSSPINFPIDAPKFPTRRHSRIEEEEEETN